MAAKKTKPTSTETSKPATDAIEPVETTTYNWPAVLAKAGAPTDADRTEWAAVGSDDRHRAWGSEIASGKVLTDLLRWSGQALDYVARTNEAQRHAQVPGFGVGLVRVLLAEGDTLRQLVARRGKSSDAQQTGEAVAEAGLAQLVVDAINKRRQALALFTAAARADKQLDAKVASASAGGAADPAVVASSMRAIAAIGRSELAHPKTPLAKRLGARKIDVAWFEALVAQASTLETAAEKVGGARGQGSVTQGELDAQDGRCLELMEQLHEFFEAGHAAYPSAVPRLVPISTARVFGTHNKRGKSAGGAPSTSATTPGASSAGNS